MATKKSSKTKSPRNKVRRKFTDAKKAAIAKYAVQHSTKEAADKYSVNPSLVARWKAQGFGKPERKPNKRVTRTSEIVSVEQELKAAREENRVLRNVVVDLLIGKKAG